MNEYINFNISNFIGKDGYTYEYVKEVEPTAYKLTETIHEKEEQNDIIEDKLNLCEDKEMAKWILVHKDWVNVTKHKIITRDENEYESGLVLTNDLKYKIAKYCYETNPNISYNMNEEMLPSFRKYHYSLTKTCNIKVLPKAYESESKAAARKRIFKFIRNAKIF